MTTDPGPDDHPIRPRRRRQLGALQGPDVTVIDGQPYDRGVAVSPAFLLPDDTVFSDGPPRTITRKDRAKVAATMRRVRAQTRRH